MSMTVNVMISSLQAWPPPQDGSNSCTSEAGSLIVFAVVVFWMCMIKGMFQIDSITLDNLGCTCTVLKSTLKMNTLSTWVDILSAIFLMTNNGVVEVSINKTGRHLGFRTPRRSASSQKRQKPEFGKEEGGTGLCLRASPRNERHR